MTSDPVKHILSQFGKRQMTTTQSLTAALKAIAEGYPVKGEQDRFIIVQNPAYQPDNGADPNIVIDVSALRSRDSVIEECARIAEERHIYWKHAEHNVTCDVTACEDIAAGIRSLSSHAETAGMVMVPVEPTEAMIEAGWIDKEDVSPAEIYRAMIKAAKGGEI